MTDIHKVTCYTCGYNFQVYCNEEYAAVIKQCDTCEKRKIQGTGDQMTWTITLNKYQRDNLLWLLLLAWNKPSLILGTGDWVGEIPYLLRKLDQYGHPELDENDRPNLSFEDWELMFERTWTKND